MAQRANLCFHGVGTPGRVLEPGEDPYWISPDLFLRTLDLVVETPDVRLSFDDGNLSDVEHGLPALVERGLTATFFVLAGRLDQPGSLGAGGVRELAAAGMTIGTHGMHHRPWRGMDPATTHVELVEARELLVDVANSPVTDAALPLGRYDRRLLAVLRRLDYASVHTSDRRWAREGRWLQPRFSVRHGDTPESIEKDMLTERPPTKRAMSSAIGLAKRLR